MPTEPEQVDLEQLRRDVASSRRSAQAQRRNLALFRRRPQPPRDVRIENGQVAWEEPQETRNVTQYRIYSGDDQNLYTALPVGSRQLNGLLPASTQLYISSFNENSGLESRRVLAGASPGPVAPPDLPPGTNPLASNITSATATTTYLDGQYGFTGTITLDDTDPEYVAPKKIEVSFRGPDGSTSEVPVAAVEPSGPTSGYTGTKVGTQNAVAHTGTLIFTCINVDGRPTPTPYTLSVTIDAARVDSVVGREVPNSTKIDKSTRLVSTTIGIKPNLAGSLVPQPVTYWISDDATNDTNWHWVGTQDVTAADQEILVVRPKPSTDRTFKVAIKVGRVGGDAGVFLATAQLPAGVVFSNEFTVTGLAAPGPALGVVFSVAAGAGGDFPYDAVTSDDQHYWRMYPITYDDSALVDGDAFEVRITARDFGADGSYVGPEHAFSGTAISSEGAVHTYRLDGNYGLDGYSYTRTGNIAGVEFRVYVGSRKNQSTNSFTDPTSMTFQTDVGAVRVMIAAGGAIPLSALRGAGNVTLGTLTYDDLGQGNYRINIPYTPPAGDTVFTGTLIEVEMPDKSVPLRADGTMPWGSNPATGNQKPLSFGPFAEDGSHLAAVTVPAPPTAMSVRVRVRSTSRNAINSPTTSPSATLALPAYKASTITESGSAFTGCATWGATPASVTLPYNLNGTLDQDITFAGIVAPSDTRFSGWEIWSSGWPDDPQFYQETPTQSPTASSVTITVKAPKRPMLVAFWLVSLSVDASGAIRRNPITMGVTPSTTITLGTANGTVDLSSVMDGSFNPEEFHRNPETGVFDTLAVDMTKATKLSSQFQVVGNLQSITSLSAALLVTGELQVGGGSNKVSQVKIFNASGNTLIGWIGDDTGNTGYVGAWFKQVLIGGSTPANAQLAADANGNVTMSGDLITSGTLKVGGGGGKPGKINIYDHLGNSLGWIGDDTGGSNYVGAWFKQLLIGGNTPATAKIVADASGNVTFGGNITGTSANITGTLAVGQIGTGNLPVGVVYAGAVQCGQLQAGIINASIEMTSPKLTVTNGGVTMRFDSTNYLKLTDSGTASEGYLAPNYVALRVTNTSGLAALTSQNGNGCIYLQSGAGASLLVTSVPGTPSNQSGPTSWVACITANGFRYLPLYT